MNKKYRGIDTSNDYDLSTDKDLTPITHKIKKFLISDALWIILFPANIITIFFKDLNFLFEFVFLLSVLLIRYNLNYKETTPFKKRKTSKDALDFNEINPGTKKPMKPQGITFFGNEIGTKKEIWFNDSDVRTHCLIFGTTGAGKALKNKEKILTPNGWIENEKLKIGDYVSTPKGQSKIIGVYPQGKLVLYKIVFQDNREIEVSGDHLWEVHSTKFEEKELADGFKYKAKVIPTIEIMELLKKNKSIWIPLDHEYKNKLKIKSIQKTNNIEDCQCIKIEDPRGLFITKDNIVTHNTESLLSIAVNTLNQSSGFIYIDGKGDSGLWAKVFSLIAARGRLDDLYMINYMTASVDLDTKSTVKISNTMNPLATGNAESLTELIVSLLPGGSGDGMWKGRASVFIGSLLKALVYLRDQGKLLLDVDVVRKYFTLQKVIDLSQREDIPTKYKDGLVQYVINLPGYVEPTSQQPNPEQPDTVGEQHGYIVMQFTETFGLLADQYSHIMKTQVAEVDFFDIVVGRRILVVLLPALEKSPQNLGNLGRIIIASIKNMMSTTLGSSVEGDRELVIESKPTNAPSPYLTIFDEYGYYSVEGAAVMPAQARSLGFFMIFAGQDFQAFQKGSKEEAFSIVANCAIKICMKLEDSADTLKIFQDAAGEGEYAALGGYEKKDGDTHYSQSRTVNIQKKNVINVSDLRDQDAGEAHILFRKKTIRMNMFYAAPVPMPKMRVNTFLEVEPPSFDVVRDLKKGHSQIMKKYNEVLNNPKTYSNTVKKAIDVLSTEELDSIIKLLKYPDNVPKESLKGVFAIASYVEKVSMVDNEIVGEIKDSIDSFNENQDEIKTKQEKVTTNNSTKNDEVEEKSIESEEEELLNSSIGIKKKLSTEINRKQGFLDSIEKEIDCSIFEDMGLDFYEVKETFKELETEVHNKMNEKGLINNRDKSDRAELIAENTILEAATSSISVTPDEIKKQENKDKEIDSLINDILGENIEDI